MERKPVMWLALGLIAASAILLAPFAPYALIAVWLAVWMRPSQQRLAAKLGDRPQLAALAMTAAVLVAACGLVLLLVPLAADAYELIVKTISSGQGKQIFASLVSPGGEGGELSIEQLASHTDRAWPILQRIAGTAAQALIGAFVFFAGVYAVLVEGAGWYQWIERHAPASPSTVRRLAGAFQETGRGMFFGVVGAGLLQSIVATVAYLALGVPQALALGLLTLACSVLPAVGTAIVWVPVAIGLALTGQTTEAIILAVCGIAVIGAIDNFARPFLARRGRLQLPTYVVLLAMFGGIAVLGGWGLILGPLAVRMAREAIEIHRDHGSRLVHGVGDGAGGEEQAAEPPRR